MDTEKLNMVKDLVSFFKAAIPEIWAALLKQLYVIATCIILPLILALSSFVIVFYLGEKEKWNSAALFVLFVVSGGISVSLLILFFIEALPRLVNPVYYAIMALKP